MKVFLFSMNLPGFLADGSSFRITPEIEKKSPFDGIKTLANIKQEEILSALRETREEN